MKPATEGSRGKSALFLAAGALLATACLAEVALRLLRPQVTYSRAAELAGDQYAPSEMIPFTLRKNYRGTMPSMERPGSYVPLTTNALGLRGPETTEAKPAGTKRVVVLGDSYTFGVFVGDDEAYPRVLQRLLEPVGGKVEVINAGYADGWGPDEHYVWLRGIGSRLQPDIVVYGFFIGNDLEDLEPKTWEKIDDLGLPTRIRNPRFYVDELGHVRNLPGEDSQGYERIYRVPVLREMHLAILASRAIESIRLRLGLGRDPRDDAFPWIFRSSSDAPMRAKEIQFMNLLSGMKRRSEAMGARFAVLMIPANFQVEERFLRKVMGERTSHRIARNYFDEIKPDLDRLGIPYLDLLAEMRQSKGRMFPENGEIHFSAEGHRFTAEKLGGFLSTQGWMTH